MSRHKNLHVYYCSTVICCSSYINSFLLSIRFFSEVSTSLSLVIIFTRSLPRLNSLFANGTLKILNPLFFLEAEHQRIAQFSAGIMQDIYEIYKQCLKIRRITAFCAGWEV